MTAALTIQRRVQWMDTDAAGIWHHSVVVRWAEEAEAELHRRLGISQITFGATPRVRTEFSFITPVRFDDLIDITLTVTRVGVTSVTYALSYSAAAGEIATGSMVAVFIDRLSGAKQPWPDEVRNALTG